MTDLELLEMADHCKEVIEEKEKLIDYYKSKIESIGEDLRCCEYKIKQMEHLINYEAFKNEKKFFTFLLKDVKYLYDKVDNLRLNCNLDNEVDEEEVILMLNHLIQD